MDYTFTADQLAIRETIRELVQDKVVPRAAEIDQKMEYPKDIERLFAENGILGIPFPEEYGGVSGLSVSICMGVEEIARGDATCSLLLAVQALGIGQAAFNEALAYTREREQFGQPVAAFQGVGWMLADMATRLEASRRLVYHAADLCSRGLPFTREASMAKVFTTDTAMAVATDAIQLAGGYGYVEDYPFERFFRDAKACQIYEGSNQVQRIVIAREILR